MTRIPFPRPTTVRAGIADDSRVFIVLTLVILSGLGYGVARFARQRRTAGQGGLPARQGAPMVASPPARPGQRFSESVPRPASGWAVEVHGLSKRFGARAAVDDVDLLVPRGSAFGYLGPNGAGKTTLIRVLLGLTRADVGTMSLLGVPVPAQRARALARVGAIVDEPRFHGHLSGRENLKILAAARGGDAGKQIGQALDRTGLTQRADDKVSAYSMGMRQRLGLAACLLADPQLLILDEPMNGLDPAGMREMRDMLRGLAGEGRTVVLSSHLLDEVERTCDQVAIVDHGKVIRQGPIHELTEGAGVAVEVQCSDPRAAAGALGQPAARSRVAVGADGLTVTLAAGPAREQTAELNRRLVEAGISVYGLRQAHASLEDWFLSVTSRFGGDQ
jgi:ABC-2 type transport system ATP-binding protein